MITRASLYAFVAIVAVTLALPMAGCSNQSAEKKAASPPPSDEHHEKDHAAADGHDEHQEHAHSGESLTENDVTLPTSFAAGTTRLAELQKKIQELIDKNDLGSVHHAAEEMAIVARKMKQLAAQDVSEDMRTEAGRLCNEVAGYFQPIDEAADAGNKAETVAIHKQMAATIGKLEAMTGKKSP